MRAGRAEVVLLDVRGSRGAIVQLGAVRPFPMGAPGFPLGAVDGFVALGSLPLAVALAALLVA